MYRALRYIVYCHGIVHSITLRTAVLSTVPCHSSQCHDSPVWLYVLIPAITHVGIKTTSLKSYILWFKPRSQNITIFMSTFIFTLTWSLTIMISKDQSHSFKSNPTKVDFKMWWHHRLSNAITLFKCDLSKITTPTSDPPFHFKFYPVSILTIVNLVYYISLHFIYLYSNYNFDHYWSSWQNY